MSDINVSSANRYRYGNPDFDDRYDDTAMGAALGAAGGALGGPAGVVVGAGIGALGGLISDLKDRASYEPKFGQDNKPKK